MSSTFHTENTQDTSARQEWLYSEVTRLEGLIQTHYNVLVAASDTVRQSSVEIGKLLHEVDSRELYKADNYANMTEYCRVRWPKLSKVRLSQLLDCGAIISEIEKHNQECLIPIQQLTNSEFVNSAPLPVPTSEGQTRVLAGLPKEDRLPVYALATETAGGVPSARIITETAEALEHGEPADRFSTLDTDPHPKRGKAKIPTPPTPSNHHLPRNLMMAHAVEYSHGTLLFTARRKAFTLRDGTEVKEKIFHVGITVLDLDAHGFQLVAKNVPEEELAKELAFQKGELANTEEEPGIAEQAMMQMFNTIGNE